MEGCGWYLLGPCPESPGPFPLLKTCPLPLATGSPAGPIVFSLRTLCSYSLHVSFISQNLRVTDL